MQFAHLHKKEIMISNTEVPGILFQRIPGITMDLTKVNQAEVFKTLTCLSDYTKMQVHNGDAEESQKCFIAAAEFSTRG
jgi:hypothetical protein